MAVRLLLCSVLALGFLIACDDDVELDRGAGDRPDAGDPSESDAQLPRGALDSGTCEDASTDCGVEACIEPGGACEAHSECCGFYAEPGALCVDPDGPTGEIGAVCSAGCDARHPCPTGFRCNATTGPTDVCVRVD